MTALRSILRTAAAVFMTAAACCAYAQETPYKWDLGVAAGMSGYAGDASNSVFRHPGATVQADMRYLPSSRWAVRGVLSVLGISGNSADMPGVRPGGQEYTFKSTVVDAGARLEFNFFPYGMGETYKHLRRWSPYLTAGLGVTVATCNGYTAAGPSLPMGMGIKYKLSECLNMGVEFTMTKVFNDHIDGRNLSDLTTIKSSFVKNNDWYSRLAVGISYEFGRRCETCHYVD